MIRNDQNDQCLCVYLKIESVGYADGFYVGFREKEASRAISRLSLNWRQMELTFTERIKSRIFISI